MARLPVPGEDNGIWGNLLNDFLLVSHTSTGTIEANAIGDDQVSSISQGKVTGLSSALSAKAADNAVVHLTGAESVAGIKTFVDSPVVPTPTNPTDTANKTYVDTVPKTMQIKASDETTTLTTGDGKVVVAISSDLNGRNLTSAQAYITTVSSSGVLTVQVRNITNASVDMLSTPITIDANETTSYTAATPSVINGTNNAVATGDLIAIDLDAAGTGAKGLGIILIFSAP